MRRRAYHVCSQEVEEIEGESTAERRKRIKAMKAGGEKFANIAKKDSQEQSSKKHDGDDADIGHGPAPQWEEIKTCREGNLSGLHCIKLGEEKEVDPSRECIFSSCLRQAYYSGSWHGCDIAAFRFFAPECL